MLRAFPPETGHELALQGLEMGLGPRMRTAFDPILTTQLCGLVLPSPIGLAAGFDKDARAPDAMLRAGFGFVECGTVTPRPQQGNARPRLFRLAADRAVINRMGFNNGGLDAFCERLLKRAQKSGIVGANIGANKDSTDRIGDYCLGLERVWPFASYVAINISSPNTPGLRQLQQRGALDDLLGRINEVRANLTSMHGARPVFLKVAPDLVDEDIATISQAVMAHRVDALIVSNTTVSRPISLSSPTRFQEGGLSGRPLFEPSTQVLRGFAQVLAGKVPIIGVGGVEDGRTALAKIQAGASAVQLYSALVYQGPDLAARIAADLAARLRAEGFNSLAQAVGTAT